MKVIIVTQNFYPDNFLVNDISQYLAKDNHVTVLTGLPDYAKNRVPDQYKWFKKRHEIYNGVEIIRVPIIARHTGKIWRALNYVSFFISSSIYAHVGHLEADVIMSYQTAPALMINAAIILKNRLKKPLLIYCLDIWPDQLKVWNVYENSLIYKATHRYCKFAYQKADIVAISSESFRNYLININKVTPDKILLLPQHSASMKIENISNTFMHNHEIPIFVIAGSIGKQQNVECVVKAVSLVPADIGFIVHIYGDGQNLEICKRLAAQTKVTDKVIFHGRVPQDELKKVYAVTDAFILTMRSEKEIGFSANTVPTRLHNYMSAGKVIIASIDGSAKDLIRQYGLGISVPASESEQLANAIINFVEHRTNYAECGHNCLAYFQTNCRLDIFCDRLMSMFKEILKRNKVRC